MIYPSILDRKYNEYYPFVQEVATKVKETLIDFCEKKGYAFISRIKTVESLAEKIETGRFKQWSDINDLFACTIIINNLSHENEVIEFCRRTFNIIKTTKRGQNQKSPDSFIFDSTRIDAKLKQPPDFEIESGNYLSIYDIIFEIQIKSAFEHAWSVATHDLVYKSDEIDWRMFRLAAQIKATVEQLDTLILAFEETSKLIQDNNYPDIKVKRQLLKEINKLFDTKKLPEELQPKDMSRFCDNLCLLWEYRKDKKVKQLAIIKQVAREIQSTPSNRIPRSISLFQYFFAILIKKDIIELPSEKYYFHVTDELRTLYPHIQFNDDSAFLY